eukprot:GFUD01019081.1.p1 GENE.GFUD01019081.1~~GFUD01019081.1.p1  ORF type:complete len:273 (+),score=93.14 GFUD01019081.1:60-878(+)
MKYWETDQSIPLPWRDVACGYWWRYPNPRSQHVFSVDMLDTRVEGDKLYARRLIMKTNPLPSWGKHFFAARRVAVIEEVVVDRGKKELVWYTRNIGLASFMATVERVTLYPREETRTSEIQTNLNGIQTTMAGTQTTMPDTQTTMPDTQTSVRKQCWIESSILGFRSAINKFGVDRYKKNCGPATMGMQMVIEEKLARDQVVRLGLSEASNPCSCEAKAAQCEAKVAQCEAKAGQCEARLGQGHKAQLSEASSGQIYEAVKRSLCDSTQKIT